MFKNQCDISIRNTISKDTLIKSIDYRNLMSELYEIDKRCKAFSRLVQPGCLDNLIKEFFSAVQGKRSEY
jgi:hypothetical protein